MVTHSFYDYVDRPDWAESIRIGDEMLAEAGVIKRSVHVPLGPVLFNGQEVVL